MRKVLVSDPIAQEGIEKLKESVTVDVITDLDEAGLKKCIGEYDGLIVRSGTKVTKGIIEAGDKLQVIGRAGVGVDNIDVETATKKGILVVNSPEANTIAACEHTIALMMTLARNVAQANIRLKGGEWKRQKFIGVEVYNKTLGIIGLGKIGSEVAKRAKGLEMKVLGYDPYVSSEKAKKLGVELVELNDLLKQSDFITLHVPLTAETRHIIGKKTLDLMKPGVRIINCSRGGVVDEEALYEAIKSGKVAGAALDVFEKEPPSDSPLLELDQVVVTPHLGASTVEAQIGVAMDIVAQVVDVLNGLSAKSSVNMPVLSREMRALVEPYIILGDKMGRLHAQLADEYIKIVDITYSGEVAELELDPITRSLLKGLLDPIMPGSVNFVNAPVLAESMGIKVRESKSRLPADYANLITTVVRTDSKERIIAGTLFGKKDMRIVRIDDYRVDIIPEGYILVSYYIDKPGVIGRVGTVLGKNDINIAEMRVGRKAIGGEAVMALNVDSYIPEDIIKEIEKAPNIISAKLVKF